jgi:NAD(P)-dependent dehydrogenase (short-subunit alcohol dehydrogenase family)
MANAAANSSKRMAGKVALVVGGGADGPPREGEKISIGNGRATAILCAREGASVVVADLSLALAKETADFIRADAEYQASERFAADVEYWKDRFRTLPAALVERKAFGDRIDHARSVLTLERPLYDRVAAFAGANGVSTFHVLLAALYEGRWLVIAATLLAVAGGAIYAFTAAPIYRTDALVQVEDKASQAQGLKELSEMFGAEAAASTEIELIGSRAVISHVVDVLHLDIVAAYEAVQQAGTAGAHEAAS